jgi:hypothetical protein
MRAVMSQDQSGQTAGAGAPADGSRGKESVRLSAVDRIVVPLVVAILAFLASFVAANISNSGAAENQRAQIEEQRKKDDRDRRFEIYVAYLDAVSAFTPPFRQMIKCLRVTPQDRGSCAKALSENEIRNDLQSSFNRVVIYGSDRVHAAARELFVAMLPFDEPLPPVRQTGQPVPSSAPRVVEVAPRELPTSVGALSADDVEARYRRAYAGFLSVVCSELPNIPRASC